MEIKKILIYGVCLLLFTKVQGQTNKFSPTDEELREMNEAIEADSNLAKVISWYGNPVSLYSNYKKNIFLADSIWHNAQQNIHNMNIGTTKKLEIIPLVDWFVDSDNLRGESGVSYLIKTDDKTILFDLGLNKKQTHPSPLLHNMSKLGYTIDDIDILVLSHNHNDHVGGTRWYQRNTFSFTNYQMELNNLIVYTPDKMTYPGLNTIHTPYPKIISSGVATIGVIQKPVFMTNIKEQALAINVKDKGIVVIVGCGHQTIKCIVERTNALFDEPFYGIFGGCHFPLEEKRNITSIHKYFVAEMLPWERLTIEDVYANINILKQNGVKIAGISPHDSCDKSIEAFKKVFRENYHDIIVGRKIIIK